MTEAEQVADRKATDIPLNARIAPIEVEDPFDPQARIVVIRSITTDPLAWMHSHHRIDDASYAAGRLWQAIFTRSTLGSIRSIDTTKEAVSGGRFPDALTGSQIKAMAQLRDLAAALDRAKPGLNKLTCDILGRGLFPKQVAEEDGKYGQYAAKAVSKRFYRALLVLAFELGLATTAAKPPKTSPKPRQET